MPRRDITLSVDVAAAVETVWGVVTDWEALGWPLVRPLFTIGLRHSLRRLGRHCEELAER